MRRTNMKNIWVHTIIRERKRLPVRLKNKKNNAMIMLVCTNAVKNSATKLTNTRVHQRIHPSVIRKSLFQSKKWILKTFKIVLWFLNNLKGALRIRKVALQILRALQALPLISPSIVKVYKLGTKISKRNIVR